MSYYGTAHHGTSFYGTNYYGPQSVVTPRPPKRKGGGGNFSGAVPKRYKRPGEDDEQIIIAVIEKFLSEVIN